MMWIIDSIPFESEGEGGVGDEKDNSLKKEVVIVRLCGKKEVVVVDTIHFMERAVTKYLDGERAKNVTVVPYSSKVDDTDRYATILDKIKNIVGKECKILVIRNFSDIIRDIFLSYRGITESVKDEKYIKVSREIKSKFSKQLTDAFSGFQMILLFNSASPWRTFYPPRVQFNPEKIASYEEFYADLSNEKHSDFYKNYLSDLAYNRISIVDFYDKMENVRSPEEFLDYLGKKI